MFSLLIPWALLLLMLVTLFLLVRKKWLWAAVLLLAIIVVNAWSDCFCVGFRNTMTGDVKILSFNVNGSGDYNWQRTVSLLRLIKEADADFLYMTENFKPLDDSLYQSLHEIYPYDTRLMLPHNVIYSKYPIDKARIYDRFSNGSSFVVRCSATVRGKELTLFGCHLSSNNYSKDLNYLTPGKVSTLSDVRRYISNTADAFRQRGIEADTIICHWLKSERVVVMGDMNDVCGAPSLCKFSKAGFKDAWGVGGFGYGATIHHPLPYRIDHVLYNSGLKLKGIKKIDAKGISDHDALVAVFEVE